MTKKPTGYLFWRKSGWRARIKMEVDGKSIRPTFDLKTDNKAAARVNFKQLLEQHLRVKPRAVRVETFREAAERVSTRGQHRNQREHGSRHFGACVRLHRHLRFDKLRRRKVGSYEVRGGCGQSKQSIEHLRDYISPVLWVAARRDDRRERGEQGSDPKVGEG